MRVRDPVDGRLLDDRMHPVGRDFYDPDCTVPVDGHHEYRRHVRLLHERHDHGLHLRIDSRPCHGIQQTTFTNRPWRGQTRRV